MGIAEACGARTQPFFYPHKQRYNLRPSAKRHQHRRAGDLDQPAAVKQFDDWPHERVDRFIAYLVKHRHRSVNYAYYQAEGIPIGSGEIESTAKQVGRRLKILGTQWDEDNVQQVLQQRCAYLNSYFSR